MQLVYAADKSVEKSCSVWDGTIPDWHNCWTALHESLSRLYWAGKKIHKVKSFHYRKRWWKFPLTNDITLNLLLELVSVYSLGAWWFSSRGSEKRHLVIWKTQLNMKSPQTWLLLSWKGWCVPTWESSDNHENSTRQQSGSKSNGQRSYKSTVNSFCSGYASLSTETARNWDYALPNLNSTTKALFLSFGRWLFLIKTCLLIAISCVNLISRKAWLELICFV